MLSGRPQPFDGSCLPRLRSPFFRRSLCMKRAETEHAELVRLCETGRIAAAGALLKSHIEEVGKSLRHYLQEHQKIDGGR